MRGVTVAGKDDRYSRTVKGVERGALGQTRLQFSDNAATLIWQSVTSATAPFEGRVPMPVTDSAAGGVRLFAFEARV